MNRKNLSFSFLHIDAFVDRLLSRANEQSITSYAVWIGVFTLATLFILSCCISLSQHVEILNTLQETDLTPLQDSLAQFNTALSFAANTLPSVVG